MIHRVWQILTSLQRLITLDTKVQLQHGRYHLKDMTHIFLPIKRNKLITPFFIYISMVFCRPSTFCCIPGQLHLLIIFYIRLRNPFENIFSTMFYNCNNIIEWETNEKSQEPTNWNQKIFETEQESFFCSLHIKLQCIDSQLCLITFKSCCDNLVQGVPKKWPVAFMLISSLNLHI